MEQSLEISTSLGLHRRTSVQPGNKGDLLIKLGRTGEAEEGLRESVEIAKEHYPFAFAIFQGSLGDLLASRNQFKEALILLQLAEP